MISFLKSFFRTSTSRALKAFTPQDPVNVDQWLSDNKDYIKASLKQQYGSGDFYVKYGFFDKSHGSPTFSVQPVYCPETVPGWGYINGRTEAKRILPLNRMSDFLTEADDLGYTEYAVFLNRTLAATITAQHNSLWLYTIGEGKHLDLLNLENLTGDPRVGLRHLGISLLYTFMKEYEYRRDRHKATMDDTSDLINNFT